MKLIIKTKYFYLIESIINRVRMLQVFEFFLIKYETIVTLDSIYAVYDKHKNFFLLF